MRQRKVFPKEKKTLENKIQPLTNTLVLTIPMPSTNNTTTSDYTPPKKLKQVIPQGARQPLKKDQSVKDRLAQVVIIVGNMVTNIIF